MEDGLNIYKSETSELCRLKGWNNNSIENVWLLFTEEIGELASAIRRNSNMYCDNKQVKVVDELGDVFSYLFQIAFILQIDLNEMWIRHKTKAQNKIYKVPTSCRGYKKINNIKQIKNVNM